MGIVDAVCQVVGCGKVIRWQAGDPMRCAEHGGVTIISVRQAVEVDLPLDKDKYTIDWDPKDIVAMSFEQQIGKTIINSHRRTN